MDEGFLHPHYPWLSSGSSDHDHNVLVRKYLLSTFCRLMTLLENSGHLSMSACLCVRELWNLFFHLCNKACASSKEKSGMLFQAFLHFYVSFVISGITAPCKVQGLMEGSHSLRRPWREATGNREKVKVCKLFSVFSESKLTPLFGMIQ